MGVVSVHQIPIPDGKNPQQIIDNLHRELDHLGGRKCGQFCVDCDVFFFGQNRALNVVHSSEYPATTFSVMENGLCMTADSTIDALYNTLQGGILSGRKAAAKMESKGTRYEFGEGDVIVKLGTVCMGPSLKGIILELEYKPCIVPALCWDLMKEFANQFLRPQLVTSPPSHILSKMNEIFTPIDTIHQYIHLFNTMRKQPTTSFAPPTTTASTTASNSSQQSTPAPPVTTSASS